MHVTASGVNTNIFYGISQFMLCFRRPGVMSDETNMKIKHKITIITKMGLVKTHSKETDDKTAYTRVQLSQPLGHLAKKQTGHSFKAGTRMGHEMGED